MVSPRIAILDAYDNVLSFMDNTIEKSLHYYDDRLTNYLEGTASTFLFTCDSHHADSNNLIVGNKLSFIYNDRYYYFVIVSVDENEHEKTCECISTILELLNQYCGEYESPNAKTIKQYLDYFRISEVLNININENASKSKKLEWQSEDTLLNRLISICNEFDSEFEIIPILNDNYSLDRLEINIYKEHSSKNQGVGRPHNEYMRYGEDIDGIDRKVDISELATAIIVNGKDGANIKNVVKEELNSDGEVEYFTKSGSKLIYAPLARDLFPSHLFKNNNRYIEYRYSYDSKNENTLYSKALSQLKKLSKPKIQYDISGYIDANIGDTFTFIDEGFDEPLYISARVSTQEICFTDLTLNKTTFTNFKEMKSQIDESLIDRMTQIARQEALSSDAIILEVNSINGTSFYNTSINTTLFANVYFNGMRLTTDEIAQYGVINWYKNDILIGSGFSITISETSDNVTITARLESGE